MGYCCLSELWVFGDTSERIKAIVPTLSFFYQLTSGNWLAQNLMKMENQLEEMVYETPCVKMIEVEVEQGFAVSDGGRTPEYDV